MISFDIKEESIVSNSGLLSLSLLWYFVLFNVGSFSQPLSFAFLRLGFLFFFPYVCPYCCILLSTCLPLYVFCYNSCPFDFYSYLFIKSLTDQTKRVIY